MKAAGPRWLRRELLLRLMLPTAAIVIIAGLIGVYSAERLTERVFDRWLVDTARSLSKLVRCDDGPVRLDLTKAAESMLEYDEFDKVFYSVRQQGRHVAGQVGIPESGEGEIGDRSDRAFDAVFAGLPVRVASVDVERCGAAGVNVQIAETTIKRRRTRHQVLMTLLPFGLLLLASPAFLALSLRRTLRPLEAIAARWNERSHVSLEAIGTDDVPRELMPFATALNDLLGRIRVMLDREHNFAATVAHQLHTPLAGMRLGLARAAEAPDLASTREVIHEVDQSAQRTARLVQQLLALGRLDLEARRDRHFVRTDLVALTHDVGATYMERALDKQIDLQLRAPAQPLYIMAQADLLSEALGNLLDNALNYTPSRGVVLIEFEADPPTVCISDSGPGVGEDEIEAVFGRMVRGKQAQGEGSGLGLAVAKDIATLHGATVQLRRSRFGGASVVLRFSRPDSNA